MTYEYDPIARPYPVHSTSIECKHLERESSFMSFQPLGLLDFLQSPLFVPSTGPLSRASRKPQTNLWNSIHPLPSSCQDISEESSDEEEEEDLPRKAEITKTTRPTRLPTTTKRSTRSPTTTKRSPWPQTTTTISTRSPEFKPKAQHQGPSNISPFSIQQPNNLANLSSEGVTTKDCQGKEIERGVRRRRKRLPRLSPRASHLLQVG